MVDTPYSFLDENCIASLQSHSQEAVSQSKCWCCQKASLDTCSTIWVEAQRRKKRNLSGVWLGVGCMLFLRFWELNGFVHCVGDVWYLPRLLRSDTVHLCFLAIGNVIAYSSVSTWVFATPAPALPLKLGLRVGLESFKMWSILHTEIQNDSDTYPKQKGFTW